MNGTLTRKQLVSAITEKLNLDALLASLEECSGGAYEMEFVIPHWAIADGTWERHIPEVYCEEFLEERGWEYVSRAYTALHVGVTCEYRADFSWKCYISAGMLPHDDDEVNLLGNKLRDSVSIEDLVAFIKDNAEDIVRKPGAAQVLRLAIPRGLSKAETLRRMREVSIPRGAVVAGGDPKPYRMYLTIDENTLVAYVNCSPPYDVLGCRQYEWPSCTRIVQVEPEQDIWDTVEEAADGQTAIRQAARGRHARLQARVDDAIQRSDDAVEGILGDSASILKEQLTSEDTDS